jgi:hypothetical protein
MYRRDFYDKFLKGRESCTTDPKEYYDIIPSDRFATLINDRITSDGFSIKHPNYYKNLSNAGTGLKSLNRSNLINQFYNDKLRHEDQRLLDTLLKKQNPTAFLKEQTRDAFKTFYESRFRSSAPSSDLSLNLLHNILNTGMIMVPLLQMITIIC